MSPGPVAGFPRPTTRLKEDRPRLHQDRRAHLAQILRNGLRWQDERKVRGRCVLQSKLTFLFSKNI
jgi:hypothetical protein